MGLKIQVRRISQRLNSRVNLRKNTKDLPILLNASEQCGLLFVVNSSSVMDCRPAQNKNILMIGLCSEVNNLKQYTRNLAQNTDSTKVNTENKNSGNDDFGFQTEEHIRARMKCF